MYLLESRFGGNALLYSVGIHLCLLAFCLLRLPIPPQRLPFPRSLSVELPERRLMKSRVAATGRGRATRRGLPKPGLGRMGVDYRLSYQPVLATPGEEPGKTETQDSRAAGGIDLIAEGRSLPLYREIFERIDGQLTYPVELRRAGIRGSVTARMFFSPTGQILADSTRIDSESRYLAVAVARTLRRAFAEPLRGYRTFAGALRSVECSFEFQLTEHDDAGLAKAGNWIVGNHLSFYRHFQSSVLEWQLGPLSGLGPFAGFDVLWLPRKIGEALSNKAPIDPLQSYRDDPAW
jgi:hypothetical protein